MPALEALLLMYRSPDRAWTDAMVAAGLFTDVRRVAPLLADLAARGLCGVRKDDSLVYFWRPANPAMAEALERLVAAYRLHLVAVTNIIHSRPRASVRGFSDAFRIRSQE